MTAFTRRSYDGGGATTSLASNMGASDTSFLLTSATNWPGTPAADFSVVIDRGTSNEEKILCVSNSGTTVVVATRGIDGTSATTHSATASVSLCGIAQDFDEANQVSNLLGNAAAGSLIIGAGAATLSTKLAVGSASSILAGGTTPAWVSGTNGQVFGISGGSVAALTLSTITALTPIAKSSSYVANSGDYVNATASLTVTSPTPASGAKFGAIANYGASNASPVTVTAASGSFIGPGIPSSTTSILLGAQGANVSFVSDGTNWYVTQGAQDSGWITPSFTNSWAANGVAVYRRIGNLVRFAGQIQSGSTGTSAFTLPAGFRPTINSLYLPVNVQLSSGFTTGEAVVNEGGTVPFSWTGTLSFADISAVQFTVD